MIVETERLECTEYTLLLHLPFLSWCKTTVLKGTSVAQCGPGHWSRTASPNLQYSSSVDRGALIARGPGIGQWANKTEPTSGFAGLILPDALSCKDSHLSGIVCLGTKNIYYRVQTKLITWKLMLYHNALPRCHGQLECPETPGDAARTDRDPRPAVMIPIPASPLTWPFVVDQLLSDMKYR